MNRPSCPTVCLTCAKYSYFPLILLRNETIHIFFLPLWETPGIQPLGDINAFNYLHRQTFGVAKMPEISKCNGRYGEPQTPYSTKQSFSNCRSQPKDRFKELYCKYLFCRKSEHGPGFLIHDIVYLFFVLLSCLNYDVFVGKILSYKTLLT